MQMREVKGDSRMISFDEFLIIISTTLAIFFIARFSERYFPKIDFKWQAVAVLGGLFISFFSFLVLHCFGIKIS